MVLALELPLDKTGAPDVTPTSIRIASDFAVSCLPSKIVRLCHENKSKVAQVANNYGANFGVTLGVVDSFSVAWLPMPKFNTSGHIAYGEAELIKSCNKVNISSTVRFNETQAVNYTRAELLKTCNKITTSPSRLFKSCAKSDYAHAELLKPCASVNYSSANSVESCAQINYDPAVRPACQWFDILIPDEPEPFDPTPCGIPPPSVQLPLMLDNIEPFSALMAPLPLACNYKNDKIPILGTYIVPNTITATIDDTAVRLINPNISTSRDSFCWQLSAELVYADYVALNLAERWENDEKALLSLTINGYRWDVEIVPQSDNQAFINNKCMIYGQSITSQLIGGKVTREPVIIDDSLHARQIIDRQLNFLPISLSDYDATDWLVPANNYVQTGAPMDTVIDIAKAGGNFVESHRYKSEITIRKRWKVPAWNIADQVATLSLPADVLISIDSSSNDNMQYNSVYVVGNSQNAKGAPVHRELSNKMPEASAITHALYTDVAVLREAGIACLSNSGKHNHVTVKTVFSDKYNVRLAEVGEIAELRGATAKIKGAVDSVNISIGVENGAPVVYQTLKIDCYAGT